MRDDKGWLFRPFATLLAVVVVWTAVTELRWVNPLFLPSTSSVASDIFEMLSSPAIYSDLGATLLRAGVGLILSVVIGVPIGLLFGRTRWLYQFFELPIDFFRSIPSSALFFLFIFVFGVGEAAKIAVVFYGCSLVMLVNAVYGAIPTRDKQDRIDMLRSFGATPWQIFRFAVAYDALPHVLAGVRVCASFALVLVIVTEMFLTASNGLGHRIYDYYLSYRVSEMFAVIIILGITGFATNRVLLALERRTYFGLPSS